MSTIRFLCALSASATMFAAGMVWGQAYPAKPIRMLAPVPGGMADITGRLIAQGMVAPLAQQVIVDNRPGIISVEAAAKATADGYTILIAPSSMWLSPLLGTKVSYDPVAGFTPVTLAASQDSVLIVNPSLQVNSVKDFIALAKKRPGELNYASGPDGSVPHLAAELFKSLAAVDIKRIPYKGGSQAVVALMAGDVQLMFAPTSAMTYVNSGKLKALGVTSAEPSPLAPGLPPIGNSVPDYQAQATAAIFTPAGAPAAIVNRLNQEIVRILHASEVKERLLNSGINPIGGSPEQLAATIKSEMARMGKVIKEAGIHEE